jgi:hypothetical protein
MTTSHLLVGWDVVSLATEKMGLGKLHSSSIYQRHFGFQKGCLFFASQHLLPTTMSCLSDILFIHSVLSAGVVPLLNH